MAGQFFGMTAFGGGEGMEFAKRKLTVMNHHAVDAADLQRVFAKYKENDAIPVSKVQPMLKDLYKGRDPAQMEVNCLLAPDTADGRRDVTYAKLEKNMARIQGNIIGVDSGTQDVLPKFSSFDKLNESMTRHRRRGTETAQEWHRPLTESQKVGWHEHQPTRPSYAHQMAGGGKFHHKSSEIAQFNDCTTRHDRGRSVGSEMSAYGTQRLTTQNVEGGPTGQQAPTLGLSGTDATWMKRG